MTREIQRTNEPRRAFDEHQRLFLIPGMIAERDSIGPGVEEFLIDRLGDTEAAGGILAVDDDEIEFPVADERRQMFVDRGASGLADDVADKKDSQLHRLRKPNRSVSVST